MTAVRAIIRPDKIEGVQAMLQEIGVSGMTVTEVRGHGKQRGHVAVYRGQEYNVVLLPKIEVETIVDDYQVPEVVNAILEAARTGEIGDGRIFVTPGVEGYRIRTGEQL